jgi:hypothetical protein
MNSRTPKAANSPAASSAFIALLEIEMPRTTAFEAFEEELATKLVELEERFSDYVTRSSFGGSIGR